MKVYDFQGLGNVYDPVGAAAKAYADQLSKGSAAGLDYQTATEYASKAANMALEAQKANMPKDTIGFPTATIGVATDAFSKLGGSAYPGMPDATAGGVGVGAAPKPASNVGKIVLGVGAAGLLLALLSK